MACEDAPCCGCCDPRELTTEPPDPADFEDDSPWEADEDGDEDDLAGDHHDYEYDPGDLKEHEDFAHDNDYMDQYDGGDF